MSKKILFHNGDRIHSIYSITNIKTGKMYIGYTSYTPEYRYFLHINAAMAPKDKSKKQHIHNAINKYGINNFELNVLYQSKFGDHCLNMETHFIKEYNTFGGEIGYNHTMGGEDRKRSTPTIEKHRLKLKGKPQTKDHIKKRTSKTSGEGNGMYGKRPKNPFDGNFEKCGWLMWRSKFSYYYIDIWGNVFDTKSKDELMELMGVPNWDIVKNTLKSNARYRNGYKFLGWFESLLS